MHLIDNHAERTVAIDWKGIFDNCGVKAVTKTDKEKHAYVPTVEQQRAILAAGLAPANLRPVPQIGLTVLLDSSRDTVTTGYYHSERSPTAERAPEPRMGGELISDWLQTGDSVLIGNIGHHLFTFKIADVNDEDLISELSRKISEAMIMSRAEKASGPALRRTATREEFVRNAAVVLGALVRCDNECETPSCSQDLFMKDDGKFYLEVHHIIPLHEGGSDTLLNVAALCPHCHRELHYGVGRVALRAKLQHHISAKPFRRA